MEPNVLTVTIAAQEKGCTDQTVYNAISRGDLNGTKMGGLWLVYRDGKYRDWQVQDTGGRLHKEKG